MAVNTASSKAFTSALGRHLLEAVDRKLDLLLHRQTAESMASDAPQNADLRDQKAASRAQLLEGVA